MTKLGAALARGQRGTTLASSIDPAQAQALLKWLVDAGADEALADTPIDRFAVPAPNEAVTVGTAASKPIPLRAPPGTVSPKPQVPAEPRVVQGLHLSSAAHSAREVAKACSTLDELQAAVEAFDGCQLKVTAKHTVFADGHPQASVMLIGEAPGRDEDLQGLPFVGRSGQLLDRMLNAIGLDRSTSAYIANVIFWRPPGNRPPTPEEVAICMPFLTRHIELKQPKVLLLLGGTPVKHILGIEEGITKVRGRWGRYVVNGVEIPVLPTFHPAFLLRTPSAKKQAWQDLVSLKLKLRELGAL